MSPERRRRRVLLGLFVATALLAMVLLAKVLATVFFAITVAYVLYPVRERLVARGWDRRLSAAVASLFGFLVVLAVVMPLIAVLYVRRRAFLEFIRGLPQEIPVALFGFEYVIEVGTVLQLVQQGLTGVAIAVARAAPVLALEAVLFALLVYALLLRPHDIRVAALELVPPPYHDVVLSIHRRVRSTLYAIYVLQAATAVGTFLIAYALFGLLGYKSALSLAVIAGLLQFIPVVGPSVVVIGLGAYQLSIGNVTGAVLVTVFGLVLIGFLPDALIRPRLASMTADMPGSLYFVGFTGGVLTVGLVGFIAGPLAVALLVETGQLLSREMGVEPTGED